MTQPRESSDASIREFLAALSSAEAAHGAVSAAAVAGGLGTSLLLMVAALPKTRSDSARDRTALISASMALSSAQEQLLETIETETSRQGFRRAEHAAGQCHSANGTRSRDTTCAPRRSRRAPRGHTTLRNRAATRANCGRALLSCRGGRGRTWSHAAACRLLRRTVEPGSETR